MTKCCRYFEKFIYFLVGLSMSTVRYVVTNLVTGLVMRREPVSIHWAKAYFVYQRKAFALSSGNVALNM